MFSRFRSYHHNLVSRRRPSTSLMTGDTNSLHELSPQISAVETAVRKGVCHSTLGVEPSRFLGYFANASLFTTYGILVGSPPQLPSSTSMSPCTVRPAMPLS